MKKSWVEMGEEIGTKEVDDEDIEQVEEDREKILTNGRETIRKLATGMCSFNYRQVEQGHCTVQYVHE